MQWLHSGEMKSKKRFNKEDIRFSLQKAETQLDSLTQKLIRKFGKNHEYFKKANIALRQVRKIQTRYLPVTTHSLLRYSDSKIRKDGTIESPLSKNNWRKYKRIKDRKKLKKLDQF